MLSKGMAYPPHDEEEPFLNPTSTQLDSEKQQSQSSRKSPTKHRWFTFFAIVIPFLLNALFFLETLSIRRSWGAVSSGSVKPPYSPAGQVLDYGLQSIDTHEEQSPFYSPPGADFDQAWSDLLIPSTVKVSETELRQAGKQSLKFRDDDGYLAYLEVYHQLHCVKRLVQIRYPERYPELVARGHLTEPHFNHCIEVLRKGIMCNGDTTLNTYKWIQHGNETQIFGVSNAPKKCVDWKRLDDWARSRAPRDDYELLGPDEEGFLGP